MKKARPTTGSATKQSNAPKRRIIVSDQCVLACPVPLSKKSAFRWTQIKSISTAVPSHKEGRFAIVTDVRRDAVDAGSADDERR